MLKSFSSQTARAPPLLYDLSSLVLPDGPVVHHSALHVSFLQGGSSLLNHPPPPLLLVEQGEVLGHDGDREGDHEGSSDGTDGSHHSPHHSLGRDVTVAHGGHGDGGPPEGVNDAGEGRGGLVSLTHVGESAEDQNANTDKHQDEDQFLVGGLHSVAQTWRERGGEAS